MRNRLSMANWMKASICKALYKLLCRSKIFFTIFKTFVNEHFLLWNRKSNSINRWNIQKNFKKKSWLNILIELFWVEKNLKNYLRKNWEATKCLMAITFILMISSLKSQSLMMRIRVKNKKKDCLKNFAQKKNWSGENGWESFE